MVKYSDFQPLGESNTKSDILTDISTETLLNRSVAATETNMTETDVYSNIRSIDLSERIVLRFQRGYDTNNEI